MKKGRCLCAELLKLFVPMGWHPQIAKAKNLDYPHTHTNSHRPKHKVATHSNSFISRGISMCWLMGYGSEELDAGGVATGLLLAFWLSCAALSLHIAQRVLFLLFRCSPTAARPSSLASQRVTENESENQ